MRPFTLGLCGLVLLFAGLAAQEVRSPVKVTIKDGRAIVGAATLPLDPNVRITPQYSGQNSFGLMVEGKNITCSPQGSIWQSIMVDGSISNPFASPEQKQPTPLPATPAGKKRLGTQSTWEHGGIHITQTIEVVPSKPTDKPAPGQKRTLDTCRVTYVLENRDKREHKVAFKTCVDILIVNNDRALFASPTTEPGKILNGVRLEGKTLSEYITVLERPNVIDPGFVATMTFKHSKG